MADPDGYFLPVKRESPAGRQHLHTLVAGAWLPLAQATATGVITFIVVLIISSSLRWRDPLTWGGCIGAIAWSLSWFSLQRHWFSLTALEQVTGLDLNKDGYIGTPPASVQPDHMIHVRMSDTSHGNLHILDFQLPATFEQMSSLANGLNIGTTLSERNWTGQGRPFSIQEFTELRNEMIKRGLVRLASDKDPRQGYILTGPGQALIKQYLPSPTEGRI